ncbi:MAG: MFS transporter [Deltaproteobacteria bacterium]|nr:MFS transporter [Deltaproteobacteria bacterium]
MAFDSRESGAGGSFAAVPASAGPVALALEPEAANAFLGRRMIGLAALANFLASGVTFGAFGNFVGPTSEAFGVPRSTIGLGAAFTVLAMGASAPFVGRWLDSGRAKTMMSLGALVAGAGLLLLSRAQTLGQAAFAYIALVCFGAALFGSVPSMALATNWYVRRRGLALGFTVAGGTLASYFAPASAQLLIDAHGWRTAAAVFGAATIGIAVPLFALFLIARPEEIGQRPDGDAARAAPEPASSASAATDARSSSAGGDAGLLAGLEAPLELGVLARDRRLWLLAVGFGLIMTSPVVLMGLLVEYGKDLGFSEQQAAVFFATMVPFSLLGKIVVGGLADVAPLKPSIVMIVLVNMLVWGLLHLEPSYPFFLATGAIYGIGIGGAAPVHGVATARCFGRANFGRANGLGAMAGIPLLAGASALSHLLEGATGSYHTGFLVQIALVLTGGIALILVRFPSREDGAA